MRALFLAAATTMSAASSTEASGQHSMTYPSLFGLVLLGSIVPVVPTGAVVSAAAVVAWHLHSPLQLTAVFLVGSASAFLGDVALYWLGTRGEAWLDRLISSRTDPSRLEWAKEKLTDHRWSTLIISRLLPAGRIPVMLACVLAGMPLRSFVTGNIPAVVVWTVAYQAVGIGTGSLFPEPWEGVLAVCLLAVLVSVLGPRLWGRLRGTRRPANGRVPRQRRGNRTPHTPDDELGVH